jgi:hypothetical protein
MRGEEFHEPLEIGKRLLTWLGSKLVVEYLPSERRNGPVNCAEDVIELEVERQALLAHRRGRRTR